MAEYIFVYNHSVLKGSEETDPDPTEAIRFFYPPTVNDQEQHEFCSQLMGVVKLLEHLLNSRPTVFKLANGSGTVVCIHTQGHLTFAYFTTNLQLGKQCIVRHAHELYTLVVFYNGCLDCIFEDTGRAQALSASVARYLAFVTSSGNQLLSIFSPLPQYNIIDSINYQLVVTLLDNCAGYPQVIGGCIFYRERLVLSQLPLDITARVSLIKGRHLQGHDSYPDFLSPAVLPLSSKARSGVALLQCHLSTKEYETLTGHQHSHRTSARENSIKFSSKPAGQEQPDIKEAAAAAEDAPTVAKCCPNSEFVSLLIYVEAHSDMFLALVINDTPRARSEAYMGDLYKLCFPAIGDLEFKLLQQDGGVDEDDTTSNDLSLASGALVYDALDRSLAINMGVRSKLVRPVAYWEEELVRSVGQLHEQLQEAPVREILLKAGEGEWISARKQTNREIYESKNTQQQPQQEGGASGGRFS